MTRRLGICVLNWNAGSVLATCVETLHGAAKGRDLKLVVVDNCSNDDSIETLRRECPSVDVLQSKRNLGYSAGNNVGARYLLDAGCDQLLFVNPDVQVSSKCIAALLAVLEDNPNAGCVGGLPSDGTTVSRMACRNRPSFVDLLILYGPLGRLPGTGQLRRRHFIDWTQLPPIAEVYAVSGACLLFRSAAFTAMGGFDENTFLYHEEFIVAEQLRRLGFSVVLAKHAEYHHTEAHCTDLIPYRRRLHFLQSEHYTARNIYAWNPILCGLLRAFRYVEWMPYVLRQWLKKNRTNGATT